MDDRSSFDDMPLIHSYTADDAVEDGTLLALEPPPDILPISQIGSMDDYLRNYGAILGRKAIHALAPLHVPGRDALIGFDDIPLDRQPFPCQAHAITAAVKMFDAVGSGFLVGEMGTGKTIMGMLAAHKHAQRSRRKGGSNGLYRAIILCPDHLIGKWCREIEETIPGAIVTRFGPQGSDDEEQPKKKRKKGDKEDAGTKQTLRDIVRLLDKSSGNRWEQPNGAEWYVLGRNQAKWLSDWSGLADPGRTFAGADKPNAVSSKHVVIDRITKVDADCRPIYDSRGYPVRQNITARLHYCPACGTVIRDKKGVPLSTKDLQSGGKNATQKVCRGTYMEMIADPEKPKQHGKDRICPLPDRYADKKVGQEINHAGFKWVVKACKEPLYHWTSRPFRWSPARIIQRKLKRMFKYLVIDEVHEHKSDESGQSMACSKLIGSVDHILALTGTIIGGYANHLYPLLMRISPKSLIEEGFEWGKDMAFSEVYGRIDRIVTVKEEDDSGPSVRGNVKSMRRARSGNRTERKAVRPGVMPTMFGRHMIGSSMFITLEELADELPDLFEYVGGPVPSPATGLTEDEKDHWEKLGSGWFNVACNMEPEQEAEYKRIAAIMEFANKELLRRGSMKLLGAYLWTTLDFPDRPFGWGHDPDLLKALKRAKEELASDPVAAEALNASVLAGHTVGYWDKPGIRTPENFVGVVTPKDLPQERIYPKEKILLDICKRQKEEGRQSWVYVNMTGKRNIQERLKSLLEAEGLKVGILKSKDVEPIEREEWIAKHGRDFDVMISHPQLVSTGLDLFSKRQGGHNYSTIIFYETGYNLFTMAQAARRAWRIGQPLDCRVYYLYYAQTMQHKAMSIMSRKKSALDAISGDFSADGLAAMAGDDNGQMALAKSLADRIDDSDMQRGWSKIKSGSKKKKALSLESLPAEAKESIVASTAAAMIAESMEDAKSKPVPVAASCEFPGVLARIAALDEAFDKMAGPEPEPVTVRNGETLSIKTVLTYHENGEVTQGETTIEKVTESEPEPAIDQTILRMPDPEPEFDDTFDEDVDADMPELTEEILARMFANMMFNGIAV